jgi:threonine dehydratase
VAVVAAEPMAVAALTQALYAGRPVNVAVRPTIADGLRPDRIGQLPFDICHEAVTDVLTVDEAEIARTMCGGNVEESLVASLLTEYAGR